MQSVHVYAGFREVVNCEMFAKCIGSRIVFGLKCMHFDVKVTKIDSWLVRGYEQCQLSRNQGVESLQGLPGAGPLELQKHWSPMGGLEGSRRPRYQVPGYM